MNLENLIAYHTQTFMVPNVAPVVAESLEVRRARWAAERQARFDAIGLPRGLRVIA